MTQNKTKQKKEKTPGVSKDIEKKKTKKKTPGVSKDIRCHVWPYISNLQITRTDIKWAVILVIAYGPFNLPKGFVCVYSG